MARPQYQIGFDFDCASSAMRELLAGVRDAPHSGQWDLRGLVQSGLTPMLQPYRQDVDGMFAFAGSARVVAIYRKGPQAVVNLSAGMERPGLASVWPDNHEIGRVAAQHLLSRGLRHFAFVGEHPWHFSQARHGGFEQTLREAAHNLVVLDDLPGRIDSQEQWKETRARLMRQLKHLPHPSGVFAADDNRARMLLCAAQDAGLRVPDDISVMGANDDEALCVFASPSMSSVHLPWRSIGRAAGEMMHRLLAGRKVSTKPLVVPGAYAVERRSTDIVAVEDREVAGAIRHIWATAVRAPLTSIIVAKEAGMSRRTLDRRMTTAVGRTASEEIARVRQQRVEVLLKETDWSIKRIALEMGFRSPEELARFFRHRTGASPSSFRRTCQAGRASRA